MRTSVLFSWVDSLQITTRRQLFRTLALGGGLMLSVATAAQTPTVTPDSPLPGLLAERKALTDRYREASAQRHSLFGNKPSKKDLQEVVDALQGIVDKDQQIVDVLNRTAQAATTTSARLAATTTHLETSSRDDRNLTAQRLSELTNEAENLRQREKQHVAKQRDLEAEVAEAKQGHFVRDALIAGLAVLCVGLVVALRRRK
ncbi:hypothetical protein KB206_10265 [Microvirga sp. STS02]|uniref:hypothetical protein n=1 Tax=Hymenobacter negativus TaxID=2795026 RepID=UPI0018DB8DBD|nr:MULTISPECIES: hypothetical protein [Bacteria]MBH8569269.1 hypothetical protein [Hymenobacter negativus]MBR7209004.1 hypothetical protein [Microvirga sp. STS02]